jgi:hypothetical protein
MKDTIEIYGDTYKVDLSEEAKDKIVQKILDWMQKYKISCGESVQQTDWGQMESPNLVSDIIDDILKPTEISEKNEF